MSGCPNEFGIYSRMVTLKMPDHLFKKNGGYYVDKTECDIDQCLVDEIRFLWSKGVVTTGSCCGHGINQGMLNVLESSVNKMIELGYELLDVPEPFWKYSFIPKSKHKQEKLDDEN